MWFSVFLSGNLGLVGVLHGEEVRDGCLCHGGRGRQRVRRGGSGLIGRRHEKKSDCGPPVKALPEAICDEVGL